MIKNYIEPKIDEIMSGFMEKYILNMLESCKGHVLDLKECFTNIIIFTVRDDKEMIRNSLKKLSKINISSHVPYVVLINEIAYLKNALSDILLENNAKSEIYELYNLFSGAENIVAFEYLEEYLNKLLESNNYRIASLNDMLEKNIVSYYEEHLIWLNSLTHAIQNIEKHATPQLDAKLCNFGVWLEGDAKSVVKNNSKLKEITRLHVTLHDLGRVISKQLFKKTKDFNIIMSYLEKCEMLSLSIGAELALIDNSIMIKKSTKDAMTGALNRNSLELIFTNQFELSIATNSPFVLAMCDLDYFKKVNDDFGHIGGDTLLKEFVKVAKNAIRDSDIVIRYGGEEFAILLANTNLQNGVVKLEKIRLAFQNTILDFDDKKLSTTVSMGAIEINPSFEEADEKIVVNEFIKRADLKLYEAKNGGRNGVVS